MENASRRSSWTSQASRARILRLGRKNKRVSFVWLSNFRNFAVSLHITIEIKIQDLSHIHEAARQFIGEIGTQAADAFFGKDVITSPALL